MPTTSRSPLLHSDEVRQWLAEPDRRPRLLDVRTPAEFAAAHIPGSYNVPLYLLREHRDELARHLDDVVLVCRSGNRAAQAEQALGGSGGSDLGLHVLDGGIVAWEAAGAPVNRGRSRWDLERQIRLIAGSIVFLAVLGGLAVPGLEWVAAVMGFGLATAAITNTCLMGMLLSKLPFNRGASCDIETVVRELSASSATGARS